NLIERACRYRAAGVDELRDAPQCVVLEMCSTPRLISDQYNVAAGVVSKVGGGAWPGDLGLPVESIVLTLQRGASNHLRPDDIPIQIILFDELGARRIGD